VRFADIFGDGHGKGQRGGGGVPLRCAVRNLFTHTDLGTFEGSFVAPVLSPHDSIMLKFTPVADVA
jgi:hypothetical protein